MSKEVGSLILLKTEIRMFLLISFLIKEPIYLRPHQAREPMTNRTPLPHSVSCPALLDNANLKLTIYLCFGLPNDFFPPVYSWVLWKLYDPYPSQVPAYLNLPDFSIFPHRRMIFMLAYSSSIILNCYINLGVAGQQLGAETYEGPENLQFPPPPRSLFLDSILISFVVTTRLPKYLNSRVLLKVTSQKAKISPPCFCSIH